jgi:hypothetical protein
MKFRSLFFIVLCWFALSAFAQEKAAPAKEPAPDPQMQAMMAAMEKFGAPGPEHKILADAVGDWDLVVKTWMDPAAPPETVKGTSTQRAILGGRYIQFDTKGEMMGMPYDGFGITGYDRYNKKYVTLWLDNWGTGFYLTEGTADAAGKVRTETGVWDDYFSGKTMKVKMVYTTLGKDKFTMEMFTLQPDGKETRTMEGTYTRRK